MKYLLFLSALILMVFTRSLSLLPAVRKHALEKLWEIVLQKTRLERQLVLLSEKSLSEKHQKGLVQLEKLNNLNIQIQLMNQLFGVKESDIKA